jgi:hypothetical protein
MSDIFKKKLEGDPEDLEPRLDTPLDLRPDLSAIGIMEHERGVCEDTFENRQILRRGELNWDAVYDQTGNPTGLISARSKESTKERRLLSLSEKKPLLTDPRNNNSDYLTGLDLIIDEEACRIVPPWVIGATRAYIKEQENGGPKSDKRQPLGQPNRCRIVKSDGLRCQLWFSGRKKDDGLCRIHLKTQRKSGEDIERARRRIIQAAPFAVDVLEEMMETAVSEPVRLKAATEILDRAGVRGGVELDVSLDLEGLRPSHVVIAERLERLAAGAASLTSAFENNDIEEAHIVEDSTDSGKKDE